MFQGFCFVDGNKSAFRPSYGTLLGFSIKNWLFFCINAFYKLFAVLSSIYNMMLHPTPLFVHMRKNSTRLLLFSILSFLLLNFFSPKAFAQQLNLGISRKAITTAVPYLLVVPDSRSAGMGDAGVAISPDANCTFFNPSKLAFIKPKLGLSITYVPWLGNLGAGMGMTSLSSYYRLNKRQSLGLAMRYFDQGSVDFVDKGGVYLGTARPREFNFDGTFAMQLSPNFSIAGSGRFIYSDLSADFGGTDPANIKPGAAASVDLSAYYSEQTQMGAKTGRISFGGNISNIGTKMVYGDPTEPDFLPTNLRLGAAYTHDLDATNSVTFALDINKLLVPTPDPADTTNSWKQQGIFTSLFSSFADAQGGAREEFNEINYCFGLEYWYNNLFALRAGYFYEHPTKGNRNFITLGAGLRYQQLNVDFSYLLATGSTGTNPLANTLRFTLMFNFDSGRPRQDHSEESEEDNNSLRFK